MAKAEELNLLEFQKKFSTEEACEKYLFAKRWPKGFKCPKCGHKPAQSVNRSYYAIFHAVRALLAFDKFDSKRHSAIIEYFNQHYIANGKIGKEYYKMLASAFDTRIKSDYQDF